MNATAISNNPNEGPKDLNPHDSLVRYSNYQAYDPSFDLTYGDFYHCDRPNP